MFKQKSAIWYSTLTTIIFVSVLLIVGCDTKSVLENTPSNTQVSVTASPTSIETGATSVIEATVAANSSGLDNQVVTFTVEPSDAGYFSPSVDTTDATGIAATVFTATTTGSVLVSVTVNGTSYSGSVGVTINTSTQTGSGNIDISVSPSLLLANGADTSQVTITVRDANGQPASDSTLVKIVAGEKFVDIDSNGYWSPGIDSLVFDANSNGQWDAIGLIPSTAVTTGGTGNVVVNYISGSDALTIYIKATVNDNGILGSAELSIQLTPNATINSIFLASDSINLVVKQTGGIETALLSATGYDINGNAVPEGLTINFIITDGPGGGEHLGMVGYGPFPATTNSQGIASAPISSGTISGTIRIRAYVDTVLSNATQVMVSSGPPAYIVVGSGDCNVTYWDNVNETNEIVAVVSDIYNNPVVDSTVVYFTTDEGTMKSHENRTQDQEGVAATKWISGNNVSTADGVVYIYAETSGGTVADTGFFFNTHFPDTLIVTGMPTSMPADGTSKTTVIVTGLDYNINNRPDSGGGLPVVSGTTFEAEANYLNVTGGKLENGCPTSSDRVKITSTILQVDNSLTGGNDDGIGAYDNVVYYHEGTAASFFVVALTTGIAYSGTSVMNAQTIASPNEVVLINAVIKDRFGNPLGDHTLVMTVSDGVVTGGTQETNAYGEANGFIWTAPNSAGSKATITITDTDPRGGIILVKSISVEI